MWLNRKKLGLSALILLSLGHYEFVLGDTAIRCEDNPYLRHLPGGCVQFAAAIDGLGPVVSERRTRQIGDREVLISAKPGATTDVDIWEARFVGDDSASQDLVRRLPKVELLQLNDDLLVASFHLGFAPGRNAVSAPGEALIEEYLDLIYRHHRRLRRLDVIAHTDIVPTISGRLYDEMNGYPADWCQGVDSVYDSRPVESDSNECIGLLRLDAFMTVVSRYAATLLEDDIASRQYSPGFFLDSENAKLEGRLYSALGLEDRVAHFKAAFDLGDYDHTNFQQVKARRQALSVTGHRFSQEEIELLEPFRAILAIARFD